MTEEGRSFAHDETAQAIAESMREHGKRARAELELLLDPKSRTPSHWVGCAMVGSREGLKFLMLGAALLQHTETVRRAAEELKVELPEIVPILDDLFGDD